MISKVNIQICPDCGWKSLNFWGFLGALIRSAFVEFSCFWFEFTFILGWFWSHLLVYSSDSSSIIVFSLEDQYFLWRFEFGPMEMWKSASPFWLTPRRFKFFFKVFFTYFEGQISSFFSTSMLDSFVSLYNVDFSPYQQLWVKTIYFIWLAKQSISQSQMKLFNCNVSRKMLLLHLEWI